MGSGFGDLDDGSFDADVGGGDFQAAGSVGFGVGVGIHGAGVSFTTVGSLQFQGTIYGASLKVEFNFPERDFDLKSGAGLIFGAGIFGSGFVGFNSDEIEVGGITVTVH